MRLLEVMLGLESAHQFSTRYSWGSIDEPSPQSTCTARTCGEIFKVINQLRKKIEKDPAHPHYVLTEPWLGYRFQLPSEVSEKRARRKS
jgi:hypothetical protein